MCLLPSLTSSRDLPLHTHTHTLLSPVEPQLQAWPLLRGLHQVSQGPNLQEKIPPLFLLLSLYPLIPFYPLSHLPHVVLLALHGARLSLVDCFHLVSFFLNPPRRCLKLSSLLVRLCRPRKAYFTPPFFFFFLKGVCIHVTT